MIQSKSDAALFPYCDVNDDELYCVFSLQFNTSSLIYPLHTRMTREQMEWLFSLLYSSLFNITSLKFYFLFLLETFRVLEY